MYCLVATEEGLSEILIRELKKIYSDWEFESCNNAQDLQKYSNESVNVLIVSRALPGEDPISLLKKLKMMFYATHIVLLVGMPSERQRTYIKAAKDFGLFNIVTGKLPGDSPYDIFTAVVVPKEPEREGYTHINEYIEQNKTENNQLVPENDTKKVHRNVPVQLVDENIEQIPVEEKDTTPITKDKKQEVGVLTEVDDENQKVKELEQQVAKLKEMIDQLNTGHNELAPSFTPIEGQNKRGILVLTAANKGGVGKTTVAVAVSMALSSAGVPTILVDYDLGSPNIAGYLGIKNVPGIEVLAGRKIHQGALQDLIVQQGSLHILPGVMNKTMPKFKEGQLGEIIRTLRSMYAVIVCDTPPEYWVKPWVQELFQQSDYIIAVANQSKLSQDDNKNYAPYLLAMGAKPEKIGIVLNSYSPKLHNPKKVEREFCSGFKKDVKQLPKIIAVIPHNWDAQVLGEYKGEVAGLEDGRSQWHKLAEKIARMAGYQYTSKQSNKKNKKLNLNILNKFLKR